MCVCLHVCRAFVLSFVRVVFPSFSEGIKKLRQSAASKGHGYPRRRDIGDGRVTTRHGRRRDSTVRTRNDKQGLAFVPLLFVSRTSGEERLFSS